MTQRDVEGSERVGFGEGIEPLGDEDAGKPPDDHRALPGVAEELGKGRTVVRRTEPDQPTNSLSSEGSIGHLQVLPGDARPERVADEVNVAVVTGLVSLRFDEGRQCRRSPTEALSDQLGVVEPPAGARCCLQSKCKTVPDPRVAVPAMHQDDRASWCGMHDLPIPLHSITIHCAGRPEERFGLGANAGINFVRGLKDSPKQGSNRGGPAVKKRENRSGSRK